MPAFIIMENVGNVRKAAQKSTYFIR